MAVTGRKTKYNKAIVKRICDELATGKNSIEDVCKMVGIDDSTYYDWKNKKPEFSEAIKEAEERRLLAFKEMAKSGLAKLLDVHEYEEVTTEFENDSAGKPVIKSQKRVKKKIMPNPTAVIFTLTNRDQDNWKNKQSIDAKGDFNHNVGFGDFLMSAATIEDEEGLEGENEEPEGNR